MCPYSNCYGGHSIYCGGYSNNCGGYSSFCDINKTKAVINDEDQKRVRKIIITGYNNYHNQITARLASFIV